MGKGTGVTAKARAVECFFFHYDFSAFSCGEGDKVYDSC